jgi:hypothetical protein
VHAQMATKRIDRAGLLMRRFRLLPLLLTASGACFAVVVLTHVAERLHVLPGMEWGLPNSPGHYLDLLSAISGVVLLLVAAVVELALTTAQASATLYCTGLDRSGLLMRRAGVVDPPDGRTLQSTERTLGGQR